MAAAEAAGPWGASAWRRFLVVLMGSAFAKATPGTSPLRYECCIHKKAPRLKMDREASVFPYYPTDKLVLAGFFCEEFL
jgi:hypothetical protein